MQPYLKSSLLNSDVAQDIFKFRTRMSNVKNNFHSKYKDLTFPLNGCSDLEDDKHLIMCGVIATELRTSDTNKENSYKRLFSKKVQDQVTVIEELCDGLLIRDAILEKQNLS